MKKVLIPRNIEGRKEKLLQYNIKLLGQDIIVCGILTIDETFEGIPNDLIKVKQIKADVILNMPYIPSWLKNIEIFGKFDCSFNGLASLDGCPKHIYGSFNCSNNFLHSLEGGPEYVNGYYHCYLNLLTSLKGMAENITNSIDCSNNRLISLKWCPKYVNGSFSANHNFLTSLKDGPIKVYDNFNIYNNKLTSLEHVPEYIGRDLLCWNNDILNYVENSNFIKTLIGDYKYKSLNI